MKRPAWTRSFRGLKAQIVLWTVLPLTLVLIGVAFTGVYSHEQAMRSLVQERDQALATVAAGQVRQALLDRVSDGQEPAQLALQVEAGTVDLDLESLLDKTRVGEHGVVYLVDAAGRILAHSPSAHARTTLAGHTGLATALQAAEPGATLCQAPDGERMALAYAPVGLGSNWHVIVEQPWHSVVSPVLRYSQAMPLVAALAVVVALLALYYGVYSLVRPLQALRRQAEAVAWGDFEATSQPVGGVQEIEDLHRTLDQMARHIQSYQRSMHDYIAAITRGQEEERKRLARELHDDTTQALIALGQQVEMAQKLLAADPEGAAQRLASVRAMLTETVQGVRRFSRDLRPTYLDDLGFIPALQALVGEAEQRESISVRFSTVGPVRRLSPELELAAYRIVQEALNNVLQHAQAAHAWVEVRFEAQHLVLVVGDDGQGFHAPDLPDELARQGHFGLMGIQERALLYGGQLSIRSAPGQGTEVTVRLAI
jgi:signal transduction histidine kinase